MLDNHPDPTVKHVLKTWARRMIVQGMDYNDLMVITSATTCRSAIARRSAIFSPSI